MTAPTSPAAPGSPFAGAATPPCPHVAAPGRRCRCGHGEELHNLTDSKRRTACSYSSGPKATPCGCPKFDEEVS